MCNLKQFIFNNSIVYFIYMKKKGKYSGHIDLLAGGLLMIYLSTFLLFIYYIFNYLFMFDKL